MTPDFSEGRWRLARWVYMLSGGRISKSGQLYRANIPRQRSMLEALPGMTSLTERAYFVWHTAEIFTGRGAIVDLGSWFGSTTATLAMGLAENRRPSAEGAVIDAFDRFVWESWMDAYGEMAHLGPYEAGASFLSEFERVVQPWRNRIRLHVGDIRQQSWGGGPIELLLVDAMKSWEVTRHVVTDFFPSLLPQAGYVIHQDFGNCWTPWIHLVSFRLRDWLVPVNDISGSECVVFRLTRPFEESVDQFHWNREAFGEEEVEEAFAHSLSITRPEKHSAVHGARAVLLVYDGKLAEASELLSNQERRGILNPHDAEQVRGAIRLAQSGELGVPSA